VVRSSSSACAPRGGAAGLRRSPRPGNGCWLEPLAAASVDVFTVRSAAGSPSSGEGSDLNCGWVEKLTSKSSTVGSGGRRRAEFWPASRASRPQRLEGLQAGPATSSTPRD
jgi:hypothetical protein